MGRVVNKSFDQVRKDISKKSKKLLNYLQKNLLILDEDWCTKQDNVYMKLNEFASDLVEETDNLDEIEVPEFK